MVMFGSWANLGVSDLTDEDFEFPIASENAAPGNNDSFRSKPKEELVRSFDSSLNSASHIKSKRSCKSLPHSTHGAPSTSSSAQYGTLSFGIESRVPLDERHHHHTDFNESIFSSPSYSPPCTPPSRGHQSSQITPQQQCHPAQFASLQKAKLQLDISSSFDIFSDDENDEDIFRTSLQQLDEAAGALHNTDPSPPYRTWRHGDRSHVKKTNDTNRRDRQSTDKKRRKFPGPAGSLPKIKSGQTFSDVIHKVENLKSNSGQPQESTPVVSQESQSSQSGGQFQIETWLHAKSDLRSELWQFCQKYSITQIKDKLQRGQLPRGKVPLICVLLQNVELLPTDAAAILMDESDSIRCSIHRDVICEFKELIKPGAVFILKQVSLFSPTGKILYLNMVLQNVVQLYSTTDSTESSASGSVIRLKQSGTISMDSVLRLEEGCLKPLSPPKSVTNKRLSNRLAATNAFHSDSPTSDRISASRLWTAPSFTPKSFNPLQKVFDKLHNPIEVNKDKTPEKRSQFEDWLDDDMDEILSNLADDTF